MERSRSYYPLYALTLIVAIAGAFYAQYLFTGEAFTRFNDSNTWVWIPNFSIATGALLACIALASWGLRTQAEATPAPNTEEIFFRRAPLIFAGGIYLLNTFLYFKWGENTFVRILWISGMAALVASTVRVKDIGRFFSEYSRPYWLAVAVLLIVGSILRSWRLTELPSHVDTDIALMGTYSLEAIKNGDYNWFGYSDVGHLFSYVQTLAWSMRLFGMNHYGLVLSSCIAGTFTLPLIFFLGSELFKQRVGLIAMTILVFSYTHIHFSRILFGALVTFFAALAFFLLARGIKTAAYVWFACAGIATGLGVLVYDSGRVIPVIAMMVFFWHWISHRGQFKKYFVHWLLFVFGLILAFGPMLVFAATHFDRFVGRGHSVALWTDVVWEHAEATYRSQSVFRILLEQIRHTFLSLHLYADASPHFGFGRPMVSALVAALCALGVGNFFLKQSSVKYFLPFSWLFATFILGGVLTYDPPYWPHLNIALPAIAIIAAATADSIITIIAPPSFTLLNRSAWSLFVVGLLTNGMYNLITYYDFAKDNAGPRLLATRYINSLERGYRIFLINQNLDWNDYAFRFFSKGREGSDLTYDELVALPPVLNSPALFLVYNHPSTIEFLKRQYPGGEVLEHRDKHDQVVFVSYRILPEGYTFSGQMSGPPARHTWWIFTALLAAGCALGGFALGRHGAKGGARN